jgi:hypothetical protein
MKLLCDENIGTRIPYALRLVELEAKSSSEAHLLGADDIHYLTAVSKGNFLGFSTNKEMLNVQKERDNIVVEIKSANQTNFYRQCIKGAVQLLEYRYNLTIQRNLYCKPVLVIQSVENRELKIYLSGLLKEVGIQILIYDVQRGWPHRLSGFDDLIID